MRNFLVIAGAVMAGIVLTPQARVAHGTLTAFHAGGEASEDTARLIARNLRRHGYWGFGKARIRGQHVFLQAYRGRGKPVMMKIAMETGRIIAVKTFAHRHVRSGIAMTLGIPFTV